MNKSSQKFTLNGVSLSSKLKAIDSVRQNRSSVTPTSTSSGMNSPVILSNRSEKSEKLLNGSKFTPSMSNPYMNPMKDLETANQPKISDVESSIDEYWLGFPTHSKPIRRDDGDSSAPQVHSASSLSPAPVPSSFHRQHNNLHADSLSEFIELEDTIQQQNDGLFINGKRPILDKNIAAKRIQRWYRKLKHKQTISRESLHQIMKEKHQQYANALAAERKLLSSSSVKKSAVLSEQGKVLRQKAIEELKMRREQRRQEIERKAKEEMGILQNERKLPSKNSRNKLAKPIGMARSNSARTLSSTSNERAENFDGSVNAGNNRKAETNITNADELVFCNPDVSSSIAIARTKSTLDDLLSTLHQLEEDTTFSSRKEDDDDIKIAPNKTLAWLEEVEQNSITKVPYPVSGMQTEEPFGSTSRNRTGSNSSNKCPNGTNLRQEIDLTLPPQISQRAESVVSYLDGVESSHRRIDDIDKAMANQEHEIKVALTNMKTAAKVADLQQLERASAEITTKCLQQQAEIEAKQHTIKMLQTALNQQRELASRQAKELERESKKHFTAQINEYEATISRHVGFIDELIANKKALTEQCEKLVAEMRDIERKSAAKIKDLEERHVVELKKVKEIEQAAEKLRREKWIAEREKKIKEATVKGLEPEIQKIIAQGKEDIRKLKSQHEAELLASDERAAQKYVKMVEELRQQLSDEKLEACNRERELAKQRYESALTQERMQLQLTEKRLYSEIASERERLNDQSLRQRSELESLQRQLEETHKSALELMRQEYDRAKKDQEEKHARELREFEERVKIEKQMWEEQYMKKQETYLMTKERELKEKVRLERDREIESVISQLEGDTRRQREEIERSAESRVRRLREKYDSEISELERSERQTQIKYNETKARLAESEGELERTKAVLRQKEAELDDILSDLQKLRDERGRVADIIRQEQAERIVAVETENVKMKAEIAEQKARSKVEMDRLREEISTVQKSKEAELDEIHQRVKQAIAKKEEVVAQIKAQYEAAVRRADHLEGLLEQQRKQIIGAAATSTARSGTSTTLNSKK